MAAIDHQGRLEFGRRQILASCIDTGFVIVGHFATAQNDVAIGVTLCLHNRHLTIFMDRQKVVATFCSLNGVSGNFDVAIGAIFETNRR